LSSRLKSGDGDDKDDDKSDKLDKSGHPLAKHFLVFIFTSLQKKERRSQIMVSRYGVLSLDSSFIHVKILVTVSACARFGFITVVLGFDGVSENRTAVKLLAGFSAADILEQNICTLPGACDITNCLL